MWVPRDARYFLHTLYVFVDTAGKLETLPIHVQVICFPDVAHDHGLTVDLRSRPGDDVAIHLVVSKYRLLSNISVP